MPRRIYRKKRTYRKRTYRKFRPTNRRRRYTGKIFSFKRTFQAADLTSLAVIGSTATQNLSLSLGNLPSVGDFTSLFDAYKITGVKVKYMPILTESFQNQPALNLNSYLDFNDIGAPTLAAGQQYPSWRTTKGTRQHSRYFRPQVPISVSDVSATTFLQNQRSPWISTANTNIAHIGLKVISDPSTVALSYTWETRITLYFKCKSVN